MAAIYYNSPVNVLAREVAKRFHGIVEPNRDGALNEATADVVCDCTKNGHITDFALHLTLAEYGASKGKLTVSMYKRLNPDASQYKVADRPTAGIGGDRGTSVILNNIATRIVNHPQAAIYLADIVSRNEAEAVRKADLAACVERVKAEIPGVREAHAQNDSSRSVRFYTEGARTSFDVQPEGVIYFSERLGSMSFDKAKRILAILAE